MASSPRSSKRKKKTAAEADTAPTQRPLRILMLGWEFPPVISGGLGTACQGLTQALNHLGHPISFILPAPVSPGSQVADAASGPQGQAIAEPNTTSVLQPEPEPEAFDDAFDAFSLPGYRRPGLDHVRFEPIPAQLYSPYTTAASESVGIHQLDDPDRATTGSTNRKNSHEKQTTPNTLNPQSNQDATAPETPNPKPQTSPNRRTPIGPAPDDRRRAIGFSNQGPAGQYVGDLFRETERYAMFALQRAQQLATQGEGFDVIHAHDWMTFPAGLAIASQSGKPLIAHFHSTEHDRSGHHVDHRIAEIERRACHRAARIVAVSKYTRSRLESHYHAPLDRIDVIYNGTPETPGSSGADPTPTNDPVDAQPQTAPALPRIPDSKTVLYMGRITHQKGPEYFIQAAKKVLEKVPSARFVMAGSGDRMRQMVEMAAREGVGHRVCFTGFLRGEEVDRAFALADVFVMPSVSEPFGIAALEAVRSDVPVIVSKQSGVSEVVHHALKVDFWDTDQMAELIIAVLNRPALSQDITANAEKELKDLTWSGAAEKLVRSYNKALNRTAAGDTANTAMSTSAATKTIDER